MRNILGKCARQIQTRTAATSYLRQSLKLYAVEFRNAEKFFGCKNQSSNKKNKSFGKSRNIV